MSKKIFENPCFGRKTLARTLKCMHTNNMKYFIGLTSISIYPLKILLIHSTYTFHSQIGLHSNLLCILRSIMISLFSSVSLSTSIFKTNSIKLSKLYFPLILNKNRRKRNVYLLAAKISKIPAWILPLPSMSLYKIAFSRMSLSICDCIKSVVKCRTQCKIEGSNIRSW